MGKRMKKLALLLSVSMLVNSIDTAAIVGASDMTEVMEDSEMAMEETVEEQESGEIPVYEELSVEEGGQQEEELITRDITQQKEEIITEETDPQEEELIIEETDSQEEELIIEETDSQEEELITGETDSQEEEIIADETDSQGEELITEETNSQEEEFITSETDSQEEEMFSADQEDDTEADEDENSEMAAGESVEEEKEMLIEEEESAVDLNTEDDEKEQISVYSEDDNSDPDWKVDYEKIVEVGIGQKKELKVNVTGTTEKLKYQWYANGKIPGATSSSYTVSSNIEDVKEYLCIITDSAGRSRDVFITVIYSKNYGTLDAATVGDRDVYATIGKTLELSVYAATTTNNKISYVWKREVDDEWVTLTGATTDTYKKKLEASDRGVYLCVVSDGISEKEIEFEVHAFLDVQYKEEVIMEVPYGERVTLKQDATTKEGTLQYSWSDWESDEKGENKPTYVTEPITENTTYYCEFWVVKDGEKIEGSYNRTRYEIRVKTDWDISAPEKVATDSNGRATLTVQTSGTNKDQLTYKWQDSSKDVLGTSPTYTTEKIDGIKIYSCTASDRYGISKSIEVIAGKKELLDTIVKNYTDAVTMPTTGTIDFAIVDLSSISSGYTGAYLKFIPDKTGYWNFTMEDDKNPWRAEVLSSDKRRLSYATDAEDNLIEQYLKAGNTYYIHLCSPDGYRIDVKKRLSVAYTGANGYEQHVWKLEYVSKKATCTENGEIIFRCTKCPLRKVEEIPAPGSHSSGSWTVSKKATCTVNGTKYRICSKCGEKEETQIPKTGHKFGSYVVTKAPTALKNGTKTRTCTVCGKKENLSVSKLKGKIRLTKTAVTLKSKGTTQLSVLVTDMAKGDYIKSYVSDNTKIATVNKNGIVTAKAAGKANIKITLASGVTATVKMTVQPLKVATTKLQVASSVKLTVGQKKKLAVTVTPKNTTDKVTYTSANKSIAAVSSNGTITAKKAGKTKITVQSGSKKATVTITVVPKVPTGIKGIPTKQTLKKGKILALKAKLVPTGAEAKITYKSSNTKVATVDAKGNIKAKKAGTAVITVTAGKVKATCKITVK